MAKQYELTHKKNGRVHLVDEETVDILTKRKHIFHYEVKEVAGGFQNRYVPEEVKKMSELIKEEDKTPSNKTKAAVSTPKPGNTADEKSAPANKTQDENQK